jgi:hypothetical protein
MPRQGHTTERGYGKEHEKQRRAWVPIVARGEAECHAVKCLMPSRAIGVRDEWHLGHTPDRSRWTGPEHPRCNTSEGATRGNVMRTTGLKHTRSW